jgi:hypothetical protein
MVSIIQNRSLKPLIFVGQLSKIGEHLCQRAKVEAHTHPNGSFTPLHTFSQVDPVAIDTSAPDGAFLIFASQGVLMRKRFEL